MSVLRIIICFTAFVAGLTVVPVAADQLDDLFADIGRKDIHFAEIEGSVMDVPAEQDRIIVLERNIYLVDEGQGRRRLKTMIRNQYGQPVHQLRSLLGKRVFIRGFPNNDGSIVARGIYVIGPGSRNDKYLRDVPEWTPSGL